MITVSNTGFSQQTISPDSITTYIGQTVTVCSKVFGIHVTRSEKPVTYLNLGAAYPNQKLTLVIFQKDKPNFSPCLEECYNLRDVCTTGKLKEYKGKSGDDFILAKRNYDYRY